MAVSKAPDQQRMLFVTWDGPELAYLQSLFLPIFQQLRRAGVETDILQFRWGDRALTEQVRQLCTAAGSRYRAVHVSRRFGGAGALVSALAGARHVSRAVRDWHPDLIMPRSLMPALSTLAAGGDQLAPIIFDADGLAVDERVDFGGLSSRSATYRVLRDIESQMVRHSSSVLVRSGKAREILVHRAGPPVGPELFQVVTNGRDESAFNPAIPAQRSATRAALQIPETAPLLVYAGSVGPQYRFDALAELAAAMRRMRSDTRLLVLSGRPEEARKEIETQCPQLASAASYLTVAPDEVPRFLAAADVGAAFRRQAFSTQAVAPIKLSEYLLCGVPVVGTAGVGDTDIAAGAGVFLDEACGSEAAASWVVNEVLPNRERYREAARTVGVNEFSLSRSVDAYLMALRAARERVNRGQRTA